MSESVWGHGTPKYEPPRSSGFNFPEDVVRALGEGDPALGLSVLHEMFGGHVMDGATISAEAAREVGDGNLSAGRKILSRFIVHLRMQRARDARNSRRT